MGIGTNAVTVTGNGGADTIDLSGLENGGTVTIDGGAGADTIIGSSGDDIINIDGDDVSIDGGAGTDTMKYTSSAATLDFTGSAKTFTGIETIDVSEASGAAVELKIGLEEIGEFKFIGAGASASADSLYVAGGSSDDGIDLSGITLDTATSKV